MIEKYIKFKSVPLRGLPSGLSIDIEYYISNYGNVKLVIGDVEHQLTIGHGLYVDEYCKRDYDIRICNVGKPIYHLVWDYFGDHKRGVVGNKVYQIHHIDKEHTNNRIDNLQCLLDKEHWKLHNKDCFIDDSVYLERYKKWQKHYDNKVNDIMSWSDEYDKIKSDIVNKYKKIAEEQRKQKRLQRIQKLEEQKQNKPKRVFAKWSEERRAKTLNSFRTSEKFLSTRVNCMNKGKVSIHKDGIRKYVEPNELTIYTTQGWERGLGKRNS